MIDGGEILVGDRAQPAAQLLLHTEFVDTGVLAHDRLNRLDVIVDQLGRHLGEIRRVFDDAAQAVGGGSGGRIAEGRRFALDVMGGAKQFFARGLGEAVLLHIDVSVGEPLAFDRHPVAKLAR